MSAAKQEVEALLRKLPDECTLEDIQYHLYVIEKVQRGIQIALKVRFHKEKQKDASLVNG